MEQIGENKYRVRHRALNTAPAAPVPPREVTHGLPAAPGVPSMGGAPAPAPGTPGDLTPWHTTSQGGSGASAPFAQRCARPQGVPHAGSCRRA